jgi:hypothetical protein
MQLVYMGFTQEAALRCFHFQRVLTQARLANLPKIVQFTMKADMALFMRYRIPVQEGPALCLQILTNALAGSQEDTVLPASYAVTPEHLSTFASARTSSSQLKLPPRIN